MCGWSNVGFWEPVWWAVGGAEVQNQLLSAWIAVFLSQPLWSWGPIQVFHVLWFIYFPGWAGLVLCGTLDQVLPPCHEKCRSSEPSTWVAFQPLTQGLSPQTLESPFGCYSGPKEEHMRTESRLRNIELFPWFFPQSAEPVLGPHQD